MSKNLGFKKYSVSLLLFAFGMMMTPVAMAWGLTGHRVVAEIASKHLSKKAKNGLKEIIGKESLALWANWPDFIKSDTTHKYDKLGPWHYVDVPGHLSKPVFIDSVKQLPGLTLYTQIPAMMAQVKDKSLPLENRKEALAFLIHFVGDLHQPLHVGRDEDAGGNKITVYWFDKKTNLHSVWDTELVNFQQYSYTEYAKQLDIAKNDDIKAWQKSGLDAWFYESHVLSDKVYDITPNESKLSYKYNYIFQKDLDMQLLKGGLRLAELINQCFE